MSTWSALPHGVAATRAKGCSSRSPAILAGLPQEPLTVRREVHICWPLAAQTTCRSSGDGAAAATACGSLGEATSAIVNSGRTGDQLRASHTVEPSSWTSNMTIISVAPAPATG